MTLKLDKRDLDVARAIFEAEWGGDPEDPEDWEYVLWAIEDGNSDPARTVSGKCRVAILAARELTGTRGGES